MDVHQVASSVAMFSFLTSAGFMSMVKIPRRPEWRRMRMCRMCLALVFLVVGVSCLKTVLFNLPSTHEIIQTSTLVSGSLQALLFCCTGVAFVAPRELSRRWVLPALVVLTANALQLVLVLVMWRDCFVVSLALALVIYLALFVFYQYKFYCNYHELIKVTDDVTDEDSAYSYRWIRTFYVMVSLLGLSVCVVIFLPVQAYDVWMLCAAVAYVYVTLCFVNYCYRTATVVNKVYDQAERVEETSLAALSTGEAFDVLEANLAEWVDRKEFVKNDLVSETLAAELGVSLTVFRAYFKDRLGTEFRQWRMCLRVEYACEIMRQHPDYTYSMVAEMVGIGDRSNFNKAFVKVKGMTPKEFAARLD